MEILSLHFVLSFICEYLDTDCSYDPFDELVIHSFLHFTYKYLMNIR